MKALLALLWLQAALQGNGVIRGIVQSADGRPLESAPVFAIPAGQIPQRAALEPAGRTDESGRYRIEVPAGSYHIATGPAESLIYAPGGTDVSSAGTVTVAREKPLDGVNVTTGVLSGTIRQNGKPAAGATVNAIPVLMLSAIAPNSRITSTGIERAGWTNFMRLTMGETTGASSHLMLQTFADEDGRYRIEGAATETYYVVAGWAEAPAFYPGVQTPAAAAAVAMTPLTTRSGLDFEIPSEPSGVRVNGYLNTQWGNSAAGLPVILRRREPENFEFGLPSWTDLNAPVVGRTDAQGRFEFTNIRPGIYKTGLLLAGSPEANAELAVQDRPLEGFALEIPYALVSARVLLEDGTPFWGPDLFRALVLTNNGVATNLPIPPGGAFSRLVPPGEYRVSLATTPPEYRLRLLTSEGKDLSREPLHLAAKPAVRIDIFVSRN